MANDKRTVEEVDGRKRLVVEQTVRSEYDELGLMQDLNRIDHEKLKLAIAERDVVTALVQIDPVEHQARMLKADTAVLLLEAQKQIRELEVRLAEVESEAVKLRSENSTLTTKIDAVGSERNVLKAELTVALANAKK